MKLIVNIFLIALMLSACTNDKQPTSVALIPQPNELVQKNGSFKVGAQTQVLLNSEEQKKAANALIKLFNDASGFTMSMAFEGNGSGHISFIEDKQLKAESYHLLIDEDQIQVKASDEAGYFYAVQTIRQLLPSGIEKSNEKHSNWLLPCVEINDAPRFQWRGMHMDFSRHFFSIAEVKEFLDYMALYKFNTFHMHLTDDQGWRIEIKKYPLLTEKGAWRVKSSHDEQCMELAKTNPLFKIDEQHYHTIDGKRMYGGFFTQEQIKEIIRYADERCITVMPEIDIPGHFKAAIDNYSYLSCTGEAGWGKQFSVPACLGQDATYEFVKDILSEVVDLFPGKYIHIGGDEVNIASWETCDKCQAEIKKYELKNEHELQSHFNKNIEAFLNTKGKQLMGWDEIVEGGLSSNASMMWWRNWAPKMRDKAANNGNDMVICPDFEYYFDFTNEATPLGKVYNYEPVPEHFTAKQATHVIGVQANLWSERIPNFIRLQYQTFPRALALAETAWSDKKDKDFEDFKARLSTHYERMNVMDIRYYLPPVKGLSETMAYVDDIEIELTAEALDAEIFYTLDGTEPSRQSNLYVKPFTISEDVEIRARVFIHDVYSEVTIGHTKRQTYLEPVSQTTANGLVTGLNRWVAENKFEVVEDVSVPDNAQWQRVEAFSLDDYKGKERYSMVFKGFVTIATDGIYEFSTKSDDGSLLYIGDKLVVDNGGNHSAQVRKGTAALRKGYHPILVKYHQGTGGDELEVWLKVYGNEKIELVLNAEAY